MGGKKNKPGGGVFKRLFGSGSAGRKTRKRLRREMAAAGVQLFDLKKSTVSIPVARRLYEIYRLTYPVRQLVRVHKNFTVLPESYAESIILYLSPKGARELHGALSGPAIEEQFRKRGFRLAAEEARKRLEEYLEYFDQQLIRRVNSRYSNFLHFIKLAYFDFYPVLREFDQNFEESNFKKKPSFSPVEGSLVVNELKSLHKVISAVEIDETIKAGLEGVAEFRGVSPPTSATLQKLKKEISHLKNAGWLPLILRAFDAGSLLPAGEAPGIKDICSTYLKKKEKQVRSLIESSTVKYREGTVAPLAARIFDKNPAGRLRNYRKDSDPLTTQGLPGYDYTVPLNFVLAFMTDRYAEFIEPSVNELIINGEFINHDLLEELSNSYYQLAEIQGSIETFDEELGAEAELRKTIDMLLGSISRNINAVQILKKKVREINSRALRIIVKDAQSLKTMAICLKRIIEDAGTSSPSLVSNVNKLAKTRGGLLNSLMQSYKYIRLFLKLLSSCMPPGGPPPKKST